MPPPLPKNFKRVGSQNLQISNGFVPGMVIPQ